LIGYLPHYAPQAARIAWLMNLRNQIPGAALLSQWITGFSARRPLPKWRSDWFRDSPSSLPGSSPASTPSSPQDVAARHKAGRDNGREVVLFADTFNRYFEPENINAAIAVLGAAGYRVEIAKPVTQSRPLCCGRTFLAVGKVEEAREEAQRCLVALEPHLDRNIPVVGLEPSCILGFRDEVPALIGSTAAQTVAANSFLLEEFLAREIQNGRLALDLKPIKRRALLHGHCHQKSFAAMDATEQVLKLIPGLAVRAVESSCCGMAGAFGYDAATIGASLAMGELSLLPAVRKADADALIIADGTSCRQQIRDGAKREALHVARVLAMSLAAA
jgi:Fe-S oxidoreductase